MHFALQKIYCNVQKMATVIDVHVNCIERDLFNLKESNKLDRKADGKLGATGTHGQLARIVAARCVQHVVCEQWKGTQRRKWGLLNPTSENNAMKRDK